MTYLKEYTKLTPQEKRQYFYKCKFKRDHPSWDDSMVLLTKLFEKHVPNNMKVLDAGCGNGNWVIDELPNKFGKKVGIDLNKSSVRKNITLNKIVYGSLENMPFKNNEFNAAVSLWVLEHLKSPQKVFEEISRVLKPGGYFGFVTPNKNYFLILMKRVLSNSLNNKLVKRLYGRKEIDIFPTYYRANGIEEIKKLAKKSGFNVVELKQNFDPSYTSFNSLTYSLSKILYKLNLFLFNAHIVCFLKKA